MREIRQEENGHLYKLIIVLRSIESTMVGYQLIQQPPALAGVMVIELTSYGKYENSLALPSAILRRALVISN